MLCDRARGQLASTVSQLGELHVAVLLHEPGDVVAPAPDTGFALNREGGDAEVREVWA